MPNAVLVHAYLEYSDFPESRLANLLVLVRLFELLDGDQLTSHFVPSLEHHAVRPVQSHCQLACPLAAEGSQTTTVPCFTLSPPSIFSPFSNGAQVFIVFHAVFWSWGRSETGKTSAANESLETHHGVVIALSSVPVDLFATRNAAGVTSTVAGPGTPNPTQKKRRVYTALWVYTQFAPVETYIKYSSPTFLRASNFCGRLHSPNKSSTSPWHRWVQSNLPRTTRLCLRRRCYAFSAFWTLITCVCVCGFRVLAGQRCWVLMFRCLFQTVWLHRI